MASPRESLTRRHGTGGRATRAAEGRPKEHRMSAPSKQEIRKVVLASLLGATIEWYDFFLYGVVAGIVFNKLYFPTDDPFIGTLLAYSTFAIGYLARPFGAFVFGHFGDKLGRKKMLVLTLEIMGVATVGIGLVPSYETIGILAPFLIGFIFRTCVGSATIAMVTAATMITPLIDVLGFSSPMGRVIAMLACAAGGMMVFHGNDDFFWVTTTTSKMDTSVAYKTIPIISVLQSLTALVVVFVLSLIFLH